METNFDCIVIGAGPAGLSAALNLRQRGKTVLVVHSGETLLAKAEQVDNYLGMPGLSGKQMMERFTQHARDAGAVLRKGRAGNVMPFGGRFMVNLDGCCFSERMRKLFRKNEKNVLRFCNKKAKEKRRLQRVKKPM